MKILEKKYNFFKYFHSTVPSDGSNPLEGARAFLYSAAGGRLLFAFAADPLSVFSLPD